MSFPFFITEEGIYFWKKEIIEKYDLYEQRYFDFISFNKIEKIERDDDILILNKSKKLYLASKYNAIHVKKKIQEVSECSEKIKEKIFSESSKVNTIEQIEKRNSYLFLIIESLGVILFFFTFLCLPCVLYLNIPFRLDFIVIGILICYILITGLSLYTYKMTSKVNEGNFLFLFSLIFSPISAIHALHMITKDIYLNRDWVIQAAYLLPTKDSKELIISELRRIHFSERNSKNKDLQTFLQYKKKQYLPLFKKIGVCWNDILEPPVRKDPSAYYYCPFCETDFAIDVGNCPECKIKLSKYENLSNRTIKYN